MAFNSASTGSSYFDSGYSFGSDSFGSDSESGLSLGVDTSFSAGDGDE